MLLNLTSRLLAGAALVIVLGGAPVTAMADRDRGRDRNWHDYRAGYDRGDRYDRGRHDRDERDFRIDIRVGDRGPRFEERETRVWVEPVYRTVRERVWVEPVYRDEVERVWIPDRWELREIVFWDCGRRVVRRDRVLIEPGHWVHRTHRVMICEGRWEYVERQECMSPGHWETRIERVAVDDRPWSRGSAIDVLARFGR